MTGQRGFSLVEMVIVLVLAGIVSAAAVSMFSTQNRLNARITALAESQENARSAVMLAAGELRNASRGLVEEAEPHRLIMRLPLVIGIICAEKNPQFKVVYLPLDGRTIDLGEDVDGYAFRSHFGDWATGYRINPSDGFHGSSSRQFCTEAGNGTAGSDGDYATLRVAGEVGLPVMLYQEVSFYFAPSALDESRRAFYRSRDGEAVELAAGFSDDSRFEYHLSDGRWMRSVSSRDFRHITAIRIVADVTESASSGGTPGHGAFSLSREIQLSDER